MSSSKNLKGKVAAVTELKLEYGVGSLEAFKYLKCMRRYEAIWERIRHVDPNLVINHGLTVTQVGVLHSTIRQMFGIAFRVFATRVSSPEAITLGSLLCFHDEILDFTSSIEEYYAVSRSVRTWSADYGQCICNLLQHAARQGEYGINDRLIHQLFSWLVAELMSDKISFTSLDFEENMYFSDLRLGVEKYLLIESPEDFWDSVRLSLGHDSFPSCEKVLHALAEHDLSLAHKLMQEFFIESFEISCANFCEEASGLLCSGITHAHQWLMGGVPHVRAERECTLYTFETKRRIALHLVYQTVFRIGMDIRDSNIVEASIDLAQEDLSEAISRDKRISEVMRGLESNFLQEGAQQRLNTAQYNVHVLKQNKRWLIDFLSR